MDFIEPWLEAKVKVKELHDLMLNKDYHSAIVTATEAITALRLSQTAIRLMQDKDHALHQVPPSV